MSTPPLEPQQPPEAAQPAEVERRRDRVGRHAHRARLYTWAVGLIAVLVLLVILVVENTRRVKVGWVFGHSRISLVFLVLFATVLGWLLGVATSIMFRRRTRPPAKRPGR
jgi:uncharacterized integral membrane protein